VALTLGMGMSDKKIVSSQWVPSSLKIDGFASEWQNVAKVSDKKLKVEYAFMNDAHNLYVLVAFNDPKYLSTINVTGLKTWISLDEKKTDEYGVRFKKKNISAEELIANIEKTNKALTEEQKGEISRKQKYISYEGEPLGKKEKAISVTPLDDQYKSPTFRTEIIEKSIVYEFRIPLMVKELWKDQEPDITKTIKVKIEWGGMIEEMKAAVMARRAMSASQASERAREFDVKDENEESIPGVGGRDLPFQKAPPKYSVRVNVRLARGQ
jgi:hypothetical protein